MKFIDQILLDFENYSREEFSKMIYSQKIIESMKYSFFSSGKRLRPKLLFILAELFKENENDIKELFLKPALAIEMIHTYSLIHDDLPCMDNSNMRRNIPTNHIKFGEGYALLAGDALLTESFRYINNINISKDKILLIIDNFINCIGIKGMISGQSYDLQMTTSNKNSLTFQQLQYVHYLKTGKLFEFAAIVALIIFNKDQKQYENIMDIVRSIGIFYQAIDDYIDSDDNLNTGKEKDLDVINGNLTYLNFMSRVQLKNYINDLKINLNNKINKLNNEYDTNNLLEFVESISLNYLR